MDAVGVVCVTLAVLLEFASYAKQIAKTHKTKKSAQVSSTFYVLRLAKYVVSIVGLVIFSNWVGAALALAAMVACLSALIVVMKYKPSGWKLFRLRRIREKLV